MLYSLCEILLWSGGYGDNYTEWPLNSYLELREARVFSPQGYKEILRPDVLRLKSYPNHPSFNNEKFWSIASDGNGQIAGGLKMKWHNFGQGRHQLRLPVGMYKEAYLCHAYVKTDSKKEKRMLAKFKTRLELIERGVFTVCGRLS